MTRTTALVLLAALHLPPAALAAQAQTAAAPPAVPVQTADELTVQPGDFIQVVIYREPDLNGEFLVGANGKAVLPLIGEQQVAGIGVGALRDRLIEAYRVHLRNPSINIIPLRRVTVLGEVQKPGMYSIDPTVSLAGAVAIAGGTTGAGDINRIRILREGRPVAEDVGTAVTVDAAGVRSGDVIMVGRRSWFDRNSTFVVSVLLSLTGLVSSLIISSRR